MKKIAFLTSSRADFGIYMPLLSKLQEEADIFTTGIIFGSHSLDSKFKTIEEIELKVFNQTYLIDHFMDGDTARNTVKTMTSTQLEISKILEKDQFDYIFALGDRFEMFAAVSACVPHHQKIIHIHGGEKTLGAIDDVFRNAITSMSMVHLVSCEHHYKRVVEIIGKKDNVYNIGSLALHRKFENLTETNLKKKLGLLPNQEFCIVTIHPETVDVSANQNLINKTLDALDDFSFTKLLTLPNMDLSNKLLRDVIQTRCKSREDYVLKENLGNSLYFQCLKTVYLLLETHLVH